MWRQNGSGCGQMRQPPRLPGASAVATKLTGRRRPSAAGAAGACRAAAATAVLAAASHSGPEPHSAGASTVARGAASRAAASAVAAATAVPAEAAPPLSQSRTAAALGSASALWAANRRVRLRSDGSSPKGIEWQLTSSSTLRMFQPGPRRGATCGPSTGSVYGRVRWVSPVNATPTASGSDSFEHSFIHCLEEFSPGCLLLALTARFCTAPCRAVAGAPDGWVVGD